MHAKPAGAGWLAHCPAHEDKRQSLSIGVGADGRTLLKCHAGCATDAVLSAAGLTFADLHTASAALAVKPTIVATYPYVDESGALLYEVVRFSPKDFRQRKPDGAGGWTWSLGGTTRRLIFRLADIQGKATVYIVEGEKDALALAKLGLPATCNSGGAGKWRQCHTDQLTAAGVQNVVIIPDNDETGRQHGVSVADSCQNAGLKVKVVNLPDVPAKSDISDYLATHTKSDLVALVKGTAPYGSGDHAEPVIGPVIEPAAYAFAAAFPEDHFVSSYLAYASKRMDAAHEYHEANALALVAAATPNVRAFFGPYPNGLGTNLYILEIGDSTTARKSSAQGTARDIHERAIPDSILAETSTPEAFAEQMALRPGQSSTFYVDEFADLLIKIEQRPYMAGLKGMLLTFYGGSDYTVRRAAKRSGGQKSEDIEVIKRPHLTLVGCVTPAVFNHLAHSDILNGLLARFGVVWPTSKPARMPFHEVGASLDAHRDDLVAWLRAIHAWATKTERRTNFDNDASMTLDAFASRVEEASIASDEVVKVMVQRLIPMAYKLAMLSAAGRVRSLDDYTLRVTQTDALAAVIIAERWHTSTILFSQHVGQNEFERDLTRCLKTLQNLGGRAKRSEVAKRVHVHKRQMDGIEDTLIDRGCIRVDAEQAASGPAAKYWTRAEA